MKVKRKLYPSPKDDLGDTGSQSFFFKSFFLGFLNHRKVSIQFFCGWLVNGFYLFLVKSTFSGGKVTCALSNFLYLIHNDFQKYRLVAVAPKQRVP